jgi:mannose-1-phosphate guanylyltransferase/mannose-6-phosphate isomerase
MSMIYPVILSGGTGSRLWPLSRSLYPKQLLALAGEQSLIQDTVARTAGGQFHPPIIICNVEHRFLIAEQMRLVGTHPLEILLESAGRNTAPAAAVAALRVAAREPDGLLLLLPADQIVRNGTAFLEAVAAAAAAARQDRLVTFAIKPTRPETGYGYIRRGAALGGLQNTFAVRSFVEKPDAVTARKYLDAGEYGWNSGMFMTRASLLLAELERLEPELLAHCRAALAEGKQDLDFFRLAPAPFEACKAISLDRAVMEHTDKAAMVPVEMGWSDVGSWHSLWEVAGQDSAGNVTKGDVLQNATRNSYLRSEGPLLATVGVEDMVVVATKDAVLVASRGASQDVKAIVDQLQAAGRELHQSHAKVYRPWGSYESVDAGASYQVKHIIVNPGAKLSLQMHHKRAEHWIVVSGTARVTCGEKIFDLSENQSTYIPLGEKHRLENIGEAPLHLIEVQSGSYLGEDDIVRFEDSYGRG